MLTFPDDALRPLVLVRSLTSSSGISELPCGAPPPALQTMVARERDRESLSEGKKTSGVSAEPTRRLEEGPQPERFAESQAALLSSSCARPQSIALPRGVAPGQTTSNAFTLQLQKWGCPALDDPRQQQVAPSPTPHPGSAQQRFTPQRPLTERWRHGRCHEA